MTEKPKLNEKYSKWKGVDRTEIEWNPTVNPKKCAGCGMCITSCGRQVFDYNPDSKKAVVANPYQCMVGCTSCETWCIYDAINFPNRKYIKNLIIKKEILKTAKKELNEKFGQKKML